MPATFLGKLVMSYLVLLLATWRVASLLVNEAGPGNIFTRLREAAGIEHDQEGRVYLVPERFFAQLLACVWCASVWVGVGWTLLWLAFPKVTEFLALPFALSAGAIFMECMVDALKRLE